MLQRTKHVKVWASFAKFEADQARSVGRVRDIMDQAQSYFRDSQPEQKEERKMLLETWIQIEKGFGDLDYIATIKEKLPIKVQKRRTLAAPNETATQADTGAADQAVANPVDEDVDMNRWEEFYDYVFPDDERTGQGKSIKHLKLLDRAQ